jgi:hypothetical protein
MVPSGTNWPRNESVPYCLGAKIIIAEFRDMARRKDGPGPLKAYAYVWITAGFFLISLAGHWLFGWFAFVNEQIAHQQPIKISDYLIEMSRDTLENWQSEFLQLMWQVAGLAFLLYVGSPQSKEGSERVEAKVDEILKALEKEDGAKLIAKLDRQFHRTKD